MKSKLLVSYLLVAFCLVFGFVGSAWGQATATVKPSQVPNGATNTPTTNVYHVRFAITLGAMLANNNDPVIRITPPTGSGITFKMTGGGLTAFTTGPAGVGPTIAAGTTSTTQIDVDATGNGAANDVIVVEVDLITPATFTTPGATTFTVDFVDAGNAAFDTTAPVTLKNNETVTFVQFGEPTGNNDTTTAEGTGFKVTFPSGLPDLVHDDNVKSATQPNGSNNTGTAANAVDDGDDMTYSFWASTDSNLVRTSQGVTPLNVLELKRTPTAPGAFTPAFDGAAGYVATPSGLYQAPTIVPGTLITEIFASRFPSGSTLEGWVDTRGLPEGKYFIYVSSDKNSDFFLGRSGHLVVKHAPGFLAAAWDFNGDFATNRVVENTVDGTALNDAKPLTLDSGSLFLPAGTKATNEIDINAVGAKTNTDLIFKAVDYDNPTAKVLIFLSSTSTLTVSDLQTTGAAPNIVITGLGTGGVARLVSKSDTLKVGLANGHNFNPQNRISVLGTDTSTVGEGSYTIYFAATDGTNKVLEKASDLDGTLSKSPLTLTVKHSPLVNVDPLEFDQNNNNLSVETGVLPMGAGTTAKPQRILRISWEQYGLRGVKSAQNPATLDLYYSNGDFTSATTLLADIGVGDTHKINRSGPISAVTSNNKFRNHFDWDLWTYLSAESTVPAAGTAYRIYAVITAGSTTRLVKFWDPSGPTNKTVTFTHSSYVRPVFPAKDVSVGADAPAVFTWEAIDVNNRPTSSPDIHVILRKDTEPDLGAVTTFSALNVAGFNYLANSTTGSATVGANILRQKSQVDTSFVWTANKMSNQIDNTATVMPAGTYYAYIMINNNAATAAAPFMAATDIAYRFPGKVILGSPGGANPTNARFIFPTQMSVASGEAMRIPIIPEDGGATVRQVNLFVSFPDSAFDPVDKNLTQAGINPFTIGTASFLSSSKMVVPGGLATKVGSTWRVDFTYLDASGLANQFDAIQPVAYLNVRAKDLAGPIVSAITLEDDAVGGRQTSLINMSGVRVSTTAPGASSVRIDPRATISGTVPLQGRTSWAMPSTEVTFFLRKGSMRAGTVAGTSNQAGGFDTLDDTTFVNANDADLTKPGIQKALLGPPSNGVFTLTKVPPGDYTLVAFVDRYLAGQREVSVKSGDVNVSGVQPTVNGRGNDNGVLLAGDAAGYDDDNNSATVSKPDNFIDSADQTAITTAFLSSPVSNTFADIDGNGAVNGVDLNFALTNLTTINGANDPVKPTFNLTAPKPVALAGSNANAAFTLAAAPPAVKAGETFDVAVRVKGAVAARAYEFHLGYDPAKLEPQGVVATGDLLARYGVALAEKDLVGEYGVAGAAYGVIAGATGDGGLATVRFRAIRGGAAEISIVDGFLIDSQLKVEKPKMDSRIALDVAAGPMKLHDASGAEVLGLIVLDGHAKVDFNDFFAFAEAFGSRSGAANFNPLADLNADGAVDFNDFFIFAENFGKVAVDAPAVRRATRPVGASMQGTLSLTALDGAVKPGQTVTLSAVLSGATVRGIGFAVSYDPARFEFVEAARAGDEALFLARPDGEGRIAVARAAEGGLDGSVARLIFRAKGEFEEPGRFQIADGLLLGANGLVAQVAPGQALNLATAPAQFKLLQNFPNPFNPETTIKYNLADAAQVELRVYNIVGQVVRTLVQERQAAGRYAMRWDGRDDRGLTVSSGIYFYQITAGKFKDVRKLMLLK